MDDNKKKAVTAALAQIEKQFGKGAVMRIDPLPPGRSELDVTLGQLVKYQRDLLAVKHSDDEVHQQLWQGAVDAAMQTAISGIERLAVCREALVNKSAVSFAEMEFVIEPEPLPPYWVKAADETYVSFQADGCDLKRIAGKQITLSTSLLVEDKPEEVGPDIPF